MGSAWTTGLWVLGFHKLARKVSFALLALVVGFDINLQDIASLFQTFLEIIEL